MKKLFVLFLSLIILAPFSLALDLQKDCMLAEDGKGYWCPDSLLESPDKNRFIGTFVSTNRDNQNQQLREMLNSKNIITPGGNVVQINVDFGGNINAKPIYKKY